jgi:hypothetical protein
MRAIRWIMGILLLGLFVSGCNSDPRPLMEQTGATTYESPRTRLKQENAAIRQKSGDGTVTNPMEKTSKKR